MSTTGMGPAPLSWTDIYHWSMALEKTLLPWEKLMVKSMSNAYVAEYLEAKDTTRPAPYLDKDSSEAKKNLANRILAFYKNMAPIRNK